MSKEVTFCLKKSGVTPEALGCSPKLAREIIKQRTGTVVQEGESWEFNPTKGKWECVPVCFVCENETGQMYQVLKEFCIELS